MTASLNRPGKGLEIKFGLNYKLLLAIYLLAHLPHLAFMNARFWDGWSIYKASPELLREINLQVGLPLAGELHVLISQIGWWIYPFLILLAMLAVVLCTYNVASKHTSSTSAFWVAAFSAVLPMNFARISSATLTYSFCFAFFMFAWWLLLLSLEKRKILNRAIAIVGFLLSFQTGSLLVFYAMPFLSYGYLAAKQNRNFTLRNHARTVTFSLDLIAAPVAFWMFKIAFFQPYGMFENYNTLNIRLSTFLDSWPPIFSFFAGTGVGIGMGGIFVILCLFIFIPNSWLRAFPELENRGVKQAIGLILIGLIACYVAVFPYAAVDRWPSYNTWTSTRHQLAMPIGMSIILYGIIEIFTFRIKAFASTLGSMIPLLVCSIGIASWWNVYAEMYVDHLRQKALIYEFGKNDTFAKGNFVFLDATGTLAFNTPTGVSEYAALRSEAGHPHNSLIVPYDHLMQYPSFGAFTKATKKYLGPWSKVEGIDPRIRPLYFNLRLKTPIENKMRYAFNMYLLHLFSPALEERNLRNLLYLDGPFLPYSSSNLFEVLNEEEAIEFLILPQELGLKNMELQLLRKPFVIKPIAEIEKCFPAQTETPPNGGNTLVLPVFPTGAQSLSDPWTERLLSKVNPSNELATIENRFPRSGNGKAIAPQSFQIFRIAGTSNCIPNGQVPMTDIFRNPPYGHDSSEIRMISNGDVTLPFYYFTPGKYRFEFEYKGSPADHTNAKLLTQIVQMNTARQIYGKEVYATEKEQLEVTLFEIETAGYYRLRVSFVNDAMIDGEDRNAFIKRVSLYQVKNASVP